MSKFIAEKSFCLEELKAFAALSGDYNPLHIDPMVARRLLYGNCVVHGIYLLLWAIDKAFDFPIRLTAVKTVFPAPLAVDGLVRLEVLDESRNHKRIRLYCGLTCVATIFLRYMDCTDLGSVPDSRPARHMPADLDLEHIKGAEGRSKFAFGRKDLESIFANLLQILPAWQIAVVLASTRIVGTECPGLNSLFFELDLKFDAKGQNPDQLIWKVTKLDKRWNLTTIQVDGHCISGKLKALVRPIPVLQPSMKDIAESVQPSMFSGQRALVIGGSRGLGEVCLKILAAGGAEVKFSYYRGEKEAQDLVAEIRAAGGVADAVCIDVVGPVEKMSVICAEDWSPTHVYYFATPHIAVGKKGRFQEDVFHNFCRYYVDGFAKIMSVILDSTEGAVFALFPSSIFLDELPETMGEYIAAKSAGEGFAKFLEIETPRLHVSIVRYPRLASDQTQTVHNIQTEDATAHLLKSIRCLGK